MKKCFSTLGCTELGLGSIAELAHRYGIDGIEIRGVGGTLKNEEIPDFMPENSEKSKQLLHDAGIRPVVLGTSCKFHDPAQTESVFRTEGHECALIAARMGFPFIRIFGNNTKPDAESAIRSVIAGTDELCGFAEGLGVAVLLEVHGDFNRIETLAPVTHGLAHRKNFGLIWDVCHTDAPYGDGWEAFYDRFMPLIKHVHIKDRVRADGSLVLPGDGDIPVPSIVKRMTADGYDGYFSLEWERKWHPELASIDAALEAFVRQLGE